MIAGPSAPAWSHAERRAPQMVVESQQLVCQSGNYSVPGVTCLLHPSSAMAQIWTAWMLVRPHTSESGCDAPRKLGCPPSRGTRRRC